jgi:hypothetical protein
MVVTGYSEFSRGGGLEGEGEGVLDNLPFCLRCLMEFLPSPPLSLSVMAAG